VRTKESSHTRVQRLEYAGEKLTRSERNNAASGISSLSPVCGPERKEIAWETLKRFNSFKKTGTDALLYQARE